MEYYATTKKNESLPVCDDLGCPSELSQKEKEKHNMAALLCATTFLIGRTLHSGMQG